MIDKKAEIMRCAMELFSQKGFKDTNVAEIMKMAGMAVGTFYNYYPSKDYLFMEIFIEENAKLKEQILSSIDQNGDPFSVMQEMMMKNRVAMLAHPILKEWINKDVFQRIEQCWVEQKGLERTDFLYESFIETVRKWQSGGKMRSDIGAEMIMALLGSLIVLDSHKEEIGMQFFPEILDHLAEFVMKGLMDTHPVPKPEQYSGI